MSLPLALLLLALPPVPCSAERHPALTAYAETSSAAPRLAVVPEASPLLRGERTPLVELRPLSSATISLERAALLHAQGLLTCSATRSLPRGALRSPVGGEALDAALALPVLGIRRGSMEEGSAAEAQLGRVVDVASVKGPSDYQLPVRPGPAALLAVPGGGELALALEVEGYGRVALIHGPVVRLGLEAPPLAPGPAGRVPRSWALAEGTWVRRALDDRRDSLGEGQWAQAALPGLGAISREVRGPAQGAHDPGDAWPRLGFAHALAFGLPALSITLSLTNTEPACFTFCTPQRQPIPGDQGYLASLSADPPERWARARSRLHTLEWVSLAASGLTVLIPSMRRGVLERPEVLEDLLIIGEGVMVGFSTPLWLQSRVGRARPLSFLPGSGVVADGRDGVGPPLLALKTTEVTSAAAAATTLLIFEEAGAGWITGTAIGLSALCAATAYQEVRSGLAFPSDIPLAVIEGALSGAGVVLWHQLFWRGWPGDDRGSLPLRVLGADLSLGGGGAHLGVQGSF